MSTASYRRNPVRSHRRVVVGLMISLAATLLLSAQGVSAGPLGELDAEFGENGRVRLQDASLWHYGIGHAIAEQPADGKLLLAGEEAGTGRFLVYRLNSDGSQDESFGSDGSVLIEFPSTYSVGSMPWGEATAIAVQADGRIVVGGRADSSYGVPPYGELIFQEDVGLARLHVDGTLDTSFGDQGRIVVDLGGASEYLSDLAVLPTGEIVIAGYTNALGDFDAAFARLMPDGRLDPTFGTGPVAGVTVVRSIGDDDRPQALVSLSDGSLIGCGETTLASSGNSKRVMSAARVYADGTIDTGFGVGGLARVGVDLTSGVARGCVALSDGTVLLAGYGGGRGREDMRLAWIGPDGRLASQYGQAGLASVNLGASESIQGVTAMADGSIVVVGLTGTLVDVAYGGMIPMTFSPFPSTQPSTMLLAKLDRDSGALDSGFGEGGIVYVDFGRQGHPSWAYGRAVIAAGDGKLVAVGTAIDTVTVDTGQASWIDHDPDFAVARIDPESAGNRGFVGFVATEVGVTGKAAAVGAVRRSGGSSGAVTVDYRTVAGTATAPEHYTETSGTLVWDDGDTTTKTVAVPLSAATNRAAASFSVVLENATGSLAASELRVMLGSQAVGPSGSDPATAGTSESGGGAFGPEWLLLLGLPLGYARSGRVRRVREPLGQHPISHSGAIR